MKTDAELDSVNSSASACIQNQVYESLVARPLGSEAATSAATAAAASGEGSLGTGARDEGQAKAAVAQLAVPPVEAERISLAGETGKNSQVGKSSVGMASSDPVAINPVRDALAALDRRDYATAKLLFEALGRKDAAEAIENALAALDRKDYTTARRLFEALAPPKLAASTGDPMAPASLGKARRKQLISLRIIPFVDAAYRQAAPTAEKATNRRLKPVLLGALVLILVLAASAIYGPRLNWTFPTTKSQAIAGLASAVELIKAPLEALTGLSRRQEEERSAMRDLSEELRQAMNRFDQIEQGYGASLNKLIERINQNSSSRFAEITARLDGLEKKTALPATPRSEFADVVSRLDTLQKRVAIAAAPRSESADITARLDRLEKKVAVAAAPASELADITARLNRLDRKAAAPTVSSTKPLLPAKPKQSTLTERAEPSASNEKARPDNPRRLLRDYSVEDVQDGIAVVDSRYGPQQVAPGDIIPGAGRVLRIERRGSDWVVLTSLGVIASEAPQ